ncbi:sigma-54 interaction domain-containing protein [Desulfoluna spongiiphila]|uniref:sigma-54 interaction domain-containing protein n=1 Tax=Desulfoluna spongiiphila TaxID=419481 RepID=UPI0012595961|nr:sigma-54 dependent transcriptional regulator [Desulfoluna spongiiphila]VVS94397.1 rna polymerase sigma factor 54 interaction domain [Desulfoluna spongiiphila]
MDRLKALTEDQVVALNVLAFVRGHIQESTLAEWTGSTIRETSLALKGLHGAGLACSHGGTRWQLAQGGLDRALIRANLPSLESRAYRGGLVSEIDRLRAPDKIAVFEALVADISTQLEVSVTAGLQALLTETLEQMLAFCDEEPSLEKSREELSRFLELVIAILGLSLYLARNLSLSIRLYFFANEIAIRIGDMRKRIILKLSEVLLDHFTGRSSLQALPSLMESQEAIDELGDNDILCIAAMFLSSLHFNQGDMKKTLRYYNEVDPASYVWNVRYYKDLSGIYPSSAAHFLGKFHLAIGIAKSACRTAHLKGNELTEGWWCLQLTMVLGDAGCDRGQVERYLSRARSLLNPELHEMAYLFYLHVTACTHSRYGEMEKAFEALRAYYEFFSSCEFEQTLFGRSRSYELCVDFFRRGYPPIPAVDVEAETRKNLNGGDKMMRGAALRQKALLAYDAGKPLPVVRQLLTESMEVFQEAGGVIRIPQTRQLLDRLEAFEKEGGKERPRLFLEEIAWPEVKNQAGQPGSGSLTQRCTRRFKKLTSHKDPSIFYRQLVTTIQEEFQAERVILLQGVEGGEVESVAGCNISREELEQGVCTSLLPLASQAIQRQEVARVNLESFAAVAIPINTREKSTWVLYAESQETSGLLGRAMEDMDENLALLISSEVRSAVILEASRQQPQYYPMPGDTSHEPFYGVSMAPLLKKAAQAARTDATMLILGETGVGKELFARHIHTESGRKGPFIPVHPASMAESLIESELFGHEKGAFTGATSQKVGFFELANQGTLFIDEVGEISLSLQVKLLRVLQNHKFTRVGGTKELLSDFRLIAATNRDLKQDVIDGTFREDLFYRLFVLPFTIPPLRDRAEDIVYLAQMFLTHFARRYGKTVLSLTPGQIADLQSRPWQGNIRELKGIMERAVILSSGNRLELFPVAHDAAVVASADRVAGAGADLFDGLPTLKELEARYLAHVLALTGGKVAGPDGLEGVLKTKRSTIYAKLKRHGLIGS